MTDKKLENAKKRVKQLKEFYKSVITYLAVNVVLIIINLATNPEGLWFYWVTIFWGIALIIQATHIFIGKGKFLGKEWEEQKIKELMEKE